MKKYIRVSLEEKIKLLNQQEYIYFLIMNEIICPKCNSQMVARKATKGPMKGSSFWGCSKYPKCRSIVSFENNPHRGNKNKKNENIDDNLISIKSRIDDIKGLLPSLKENEKQFDKLNELLNSKSSQNDYQKTKQELELNLEKYNQLKNFNKNFASKSLKNTISKLRENLLKYEMLKEQIIKLQPKVNYYHKLGLELEALEDTLRFNSAGTHRNVPLKTSTKHKTKKSNKKEQKDRALAARAKGEERKLAQQIKKDLWASQLKLLGNKCPYCLVEFNNENEINADHIIPVDQGGLSTNENMIWVCKKCNSKKRAKSLRKFCKDEELNYESIIKRLSDLDKHI